MRQGDAAGQRPQERFCPSETAPQFETHPAAAALDPDIKFRYTDHFRYKFSGPMADKCALTLVAERTGAPYLIALI